MNKGGYAVRKVKSFRGMEGLGFNAELVRDGISVAFVMDDANGGEYHFEWYDYKALRVAVKGVNLMGEAFEYQGTPEEALLQGHLNSLPAEEDEFNHKRYPVGADGFVGALVDAHENDKRFRRLAKLKTLFRVKGDKPDEWRTINSPYSAAVKKYIIEKHGAEVEVIYNETIGQTA